MLKRKIPSYLLCLLMMFSLLSMFTLPVNAASNDVIGINSGTTYYIKNLFDGKYLDVYYGTDANATDVWTYTFNATAAQKWRAVRNSDGTYTFFAIVSSYNRVLDVTNSNVDIWAYNSSWECQKFTLVRNTSMAFGGTYQIKNGTNYVVLDAANNTVKVSSTGSGMNALWSFEPVDKGDADIYTTYYQDGTFLGIFPTYFDTRGAASTFIEKCNSMGYTSYHFTNTSAGTAHNYMRNDAIWVFRGHGLESNGTPLATICFFKDDGSYNGYLTASTAIFNGTQDAAISTFSKNELAQTQCVLYIGCSTGVSYNGYNLVSATFNKGAHFALGTTQTTYTNETDKWTKKFFEKADEGATIRQCLDHANYYQSIGLLYYEGDVYTKLK
jgi:hypothetical protein